MGQPWTVIIDVGTVAEWVGAIGGIATAGIALFLLGQGLYDRREDRRERRRKQAQRVWISYPTRTKVEPSGFTGMGRPTTELRTETTEVTNGSNDVISDVTVTIHELDGKGFPLPAVATEHRVRMQPGESWDISRESEHPRNPNPPADWLVQWVPILAFEDANGVRWNRNARHELSEGEPDLPTAAGTRVVRPVQR
ncbi:hypothetical protein ACWEOH_02435 [Agromyces sp. NPDC004153]